MPEANISETNVERIVRLEGKSERERTSADRLADSIGQFVGTLWFVVVSVLCCGLWVVLNLRPGAFDPLPFGLLDSMLAVVSLILSSFILIRQNHMARRADLRNHLALQINLLAEQESTKILQILQRLSSRLGVADEVVDEATDQLAGDTSIEHIAENLQESIDETGNTKSS